jgi:Rps23 Pro-64 3,4-dihydroxylase Tpa1-like proline 4-hydroxylase
MSTSKASDLVCETLFSDESVLGASERDLITSLIERARFSPEPNDRDLPESIARLAGEMLAERMCANLGKDVERLLLDSYHRSSPLPMPVRGKSPSPPTPGTAPHPPGPNPPGGIAAPVGPGSPTPSPFSAPHPPGPNPPGGIATPVGPGSPTPSPFSAPHPPGPNPPGGIAAPVGPGSPTPSPFSAPHPPGPNPPGMATLGMESSRTLVASELPETRPARCVIFEEFLAPAELQNLMQEVLQREMEFEISEVISPGATSGTVDFEYRRSRVLMDVGVHHAVILNRIQSCSSRVFEKLVLEPFWPSRAEIQITSSNHGDFFRCHSDNGHEKIQSRALTFVYFFHREPKKFRGGELRLYDSRSENGVQVRAENYRTIVPRQNQIVFFPSSLEHEITPVDCVSQAFADSRFTVNGWLHH